MVVGCLVGPISELASIAPAGDRFDMAAVEQAPSPIPTYLPLIAGKPRRRAQIADELPTARTVMDARFGSCQDTNRVRMPAK